ncbi:MAG: hypothetical protein FJW39_25545 [Acidobacteria bacterium]|nr:hypothetical protein [Acidobacteriota bacterium]
MSRILAPGPAAPLRWPLVYLGVAITTLATLMLELSLTRIFSVVFYYHLAFLAISLALFGLGAGGVLSYVVAGWGGSVFRRLGILSAVNSGTVIASLWFLLTRTGEMSNWTLAAIYLASAIPFVLAGAVVSLAISETIDRVDRVYFFDLVGAAGGCLLLIPLLKAVGGPNTVIAAGVLFATASAIWFTLAGSARGRILAATVGLAMVILVIFNLKGRFIDVRYAKGQSLRQEQWVRWNGISRIAVAEDGNRNLTIYIDADASTGLAGKDIDHWDQNERDNLLREGPGLVYQLRPGAKTLIIGPGGGYDVTRALASGSRDVTGVEINDLIATRIMRGLYAAQSRNLYTRPEVRIFVEDGRAFVRRSTEKYQVLQATLVDTWASTAAGAFSLSENNLYTSDAFHDYLAHLTDDGMMAFTRWGFDPPRESLRLLALAIDALGRLGEREPWRHVIVARENTHLLQGWGATDTVIISRKPLPDSDVTRMRQVLASTSKEAVYLPGDRRGPFAAILTTADRAAFYRDYRYDVSPVDDNRPFFFYTVQPRDIWEFLTSGSRGSADYKINRAVPLLFGVVAVSLFATAVMLLLPPLVLGSRLPGEPGVRRFLAYFLCIGVGYILIQVALIQKFVLFLGHPTYALTVIVFSMLVASGAGSFLSRRLGMFEAGRLERVLIAVAGMIAVLAFAAGPVTQLGVGWPLPLRMLISAFMIAPAAFLMGMPFPSGLARLEAWHKPSVRWAWSLNAAASVLGSALAVFLALYLGLRETLLAGGGLYLAAWGASRAGRT